MKEKAFENQMTMTWSELWTAERLPRLVLVCLGIWLNAADALVTATIMPSVARDIGGYAFFAWPVASYLVGAILGGAGAGRLSERIGLRAALLISALTYAIGCAIGALAPGIGVFLLGRLFQGSGAGLIVGLCYVSAGLLFPGELWRRVLALLSLMWGVATILGPLLGGLFATSWRLLFWAFGVQALLFAAIAWMLVPRHSATASDAPVPVGTLARLALAILLFLLAGTVVSPWRAGAALLLGSIFLVVALRRDARADAHLLPREASHLGTAAGQGYAAIFLFAAGAIGFTVYGAAILQGLYGLSPLFAGYAIGAEAMAWTLAALAVTELPQQADRIWIRIGGGAIAVAILSLIFTMPGGSLVAVLCSAIVLGAGFGVMWAYLTRHIVEQLSVDDRGVGSSALPAAQQIGNAFGSSIAGLVANAAGAAQGVNVHNAHMIAVWVFVAGAPIAWTGWLCAWRTTSVASSPEISRA